MDFCFLPCILFDSLIEYGKVLQKIKLNTENNVHIIQGVLYG